MASNVKPHQRAFALTIALIFLVTTLATSALVVMSIINENKANNSAADTADTAQSAGKLEGTKLENFTPVATVDKLEIIDTKEGTGEVVKPGATVTAHYTGAVAATGIIFQSSHDVGQPIPFSLAEVIKGWGEGVPGMKVGGIRRLVIPADKAYGPNPPEGSTIPVNAPLVFDIEVTAIGE
jgi:FKBP-type peptidyl-prolyl cis-trans isomerase